MIRSSLLDLPGLSHGFFSRQGGVSDGIYASLNCGFGSGDAAERVAANRGRVAELLGCDPAGLVTVHQVHGTQVAEVQAPWQRGAAPRADALVTSRPGVALGILTADCAPVLLADGAAGVIGAAHAGWRGALTGVVEAALAAMERLGAQRARVAAVIGPCIAQASYQVGPEFRDGFLREDAANAAFFVAEPDSGRWRFDLPGYLLARLGRLGLGALQATGCDTAAEAERWFSYRRSCLVGEPDYGRQISAIALAG